MQNAAAAQGTCLWGGAIAALHVHSVEVKPKDILD